MLAVDTATPEQLGACKDFLPPRERLCCVDHHAVSILDAGVSCRRGATSAAEIVWDIIGRHAEVPVRKALLCGILSDTGHLRYATRDTFAVIQELLGDDIVFEEIYSLLREEIDLSQKMALFKAMQRMKVLRAGDFLVVRTAIGSFESLVARTILSAGLMLWSSLMRSVGGVSSHVHPAGRREGCRPVPHHVRCRPRV